MAEKKMDDLGQITTFISYGFLSVNTPLDQRRTTKYPERPILSIKAVRP